MYCIDKVVVQAFVLVGHVVLCHGKQGKPEYSDLSLVYHYATVVDIGQLMVYVAVELLVAVVGISESTHCLKQLCFL